MRIVYCKYVVWAIAALLLGSGCRRELTRTTEPPTPVPTPDLVSVALHFDWSESGLDPDKMKRASALIYSESSESPIEVILNQDVTKTTVSLPVGVYRAVGLNETSQSKDWTGIDFGGIGRYESLTASMRAQVLKSGELMVGSGDHLAVASVDRFEVTKEMLGQTPTKEPLVVSFKPQQVTKPVLVRIRMENLDNARSISATLSGMYAARVLAADQYTDQRATHVFDRFDRTYDPSNPHNGTVEAQFYVFKLDADPIPHNLDLTVDLLDGSQYHQTFEVSGKIVEGELVYEIALGFTAADPVVLPSCPAEFLPVTFHLDWSGAGLMPDQAQWVSVWVYPTDDQDPIELLSSANKYSISTNLLAGAYQVVAFNERNSSEVFGGVQIGSEQSYETISAQVVDPTNVSALNVDRLVGANADRFEVREGVANQLTLSLTPVTKLLEVEAQVANLDNVRSLSCRLTGLSSGSLFGTRADLSTDAVYGFDLTERTYDPLDKRNGKITTQFYVFGTPNTVGVRTLDMAFTMLDMATQDEQVDAGSIIQSTATGYKLTVGPILVPERPRLPVEGDPSVNPWNPEQNNPLQ